MLIFPERAQVLIVSVQDDALTCEDEGTRGSVFFARRASP